MESICESGQNQQFQFIVWDQVNGTFGTVSKFWFKKAELTALFKELLEK